MGKSRIRQRTSRGGLSGEKLERFPPPDEDRNLYVEVVTSDGQVKGYHFVLPGPGGNVCIKTPDSPGVSELHIEYTTWTRIADPAMGERSCYG